MGELDQLQAKKNTGMRFWKRAALIFAILFFGLAALNLAPLGVEEVTNAFFALFIHDERSAVSEEFRTQTDDRNGAYAEPIHITIPVIGVNAKVLNPSSTDAKTLDNALLYGAVRYPGSGDLGSNHTIFIFGHSSYLPIVHNQAFKTFDGIQKLHKGDVITLTSASRAFMYTVDEVKSTKADAAYVDLSSTGRKLILSTCDSFGSKEERFVVTATFASSTPIVGASNPK